VLAVAASLTPPVALVLAGLLMFKTHDVLVLGILAAASALMAAFLAGLLASRIASGITRMHNATERVAAGDLSARIAPAGPLELRELAATFNHTVAQLDRLFETRRNLIAWASHDLRTPLASLQAMTEALEDKLADPTQYLAEMRTQVRMLSRLVDDLFELSRIETGALSLGLMDVRIDDLAAECVSTVRVDATRRRIDLRIDRDGEALARCDPDKIERVLMNLLANALRHTPSDGAVAVHVASGAGEVTISVEDTGDGLPAGSGDRVFESFWRADPSRTAATGGAGLGLAIARGIVEAHGGRIWAEDRSGGGARFVFSLPSA
jgi:signal transduction histidine kinase